MTGTAAVSLYPGSMLLDFTYGAGVTLALRAALRLYGAAVALRVRAALGMVSHLLLDRGCLQLSPLAKALLPCLPSRQ
eukprot:7465133-Alexandrium_andersonii.AAC.1